MTQKYAKVAVTGPDGDSAAAGGVEVQGRTVTLPLDAGSPPGRYTVGYRVVSADGHPVAGSYTFTVRATESPASPPSPSPSPRAVESDEAPETAATDADEESSGANTSAVVGGGTLVLVLAAVGAYAARRRRAGRGD